MDLIDKKLSEKLKLFEYIDKKYGTNIDTSEKAPPKKSELNQNRNIIQNNNIQKEVTSKNEIYDNIYSDFKTNSYNDFYQSPSMNNIESTKIKYHSKAKKNTENLRKSKAEQMQLNKSINNEKEKTNTFEREFKNYEKERSEDNRLLLLRFIHSELKYHCAQLQQMSELFAKTNSKNPLAGIKKFAKEYSIENYNFAKLKIDMNDAIDEVSGEEEKKSEVYGENKNDKTKKEEESENTDSNDSDEEDTKIKKNKSTRTKNSQIGKSQKSNLDNKGKSRNIDDDDD